MTMPFSGELPGRACPPNRMNRIRVLTVALATFWLIAGPAFGQAQSKAAESKKQTCCQKAAAAGKECRNKCCLAAHREGKSCLKCNPGKEDAALLKKSGKKAS